MSVLVVLVAAPIEASAVGFSAGARADWEWLGSWTRGNETPRALAQRAVDGHFALADSEGVSLLRGGRRDRAALGGVNALAFDRDGTLWVGTQSGLFRWEVAGRPERRRLRGGESANRILRIEANESGMLLGTEAGAFWSTSGRGFQFFAMDSAAAPVTLVAMERRSAGDSERAEDARGSSIERCWVLRGRALYELRGFVTDAGFRIVATHRLSMPRVDEGREPIDLRVDGSGRWLLLVFRDIVARRSIDDAAAADDLRLPDWRIERPVLPPGAQIWRLAWGGDGRIRIATDHGMLEGTGWSGPFSRAPQPLGSSECVDVQEDVAGAFVALCHRGVYLQGASLLARSEEVMPRAVGGLEFGTVLSLPGIEIDPPLSEIRARAIARSGLSVERSEQLREGLARRAYWPELSLRLGTSVDRDRKTDRDQSYVSGDKRHLLDRTHDRSFGFVASLQFDWDLGGVAYPDDSVDLSRELRQVVSLRDAVSDEINQLYFERQGIRERVAAGGASDPTEVARLRLRASEIDAGLDAWTGGWISRWRSDRERESRALQSGSSRTTENPRTRNRKPGPDLPVERKRE